MRSYLRGGWQDGVATTWGVCSGLFAHATLSALGLSAIFVHSATAFYVIKVVGACYLLWLGFQSLQSAFSRAVQPVQVEPPKTKGDREFWRSFREGLWTNLLNPKVAIFYLALLPQFVGAQAVFQHSLLLAAIHFTMGFVWLVTLSLVLGRVQEFFVKPVVRRWLDGVSGFVLVGLGFRLALAER